MKETYIFYSIFLVNFELKLNQTRQSQNFKIYKLYQIFEEVVLILEYEEAESTGVPNKIHRVCSQYRFKI